MLIQPALRDANIVAHDALSVASVEAGALSAKLDDIGLRIANSRRWGGDGANRFRQVGPPARLPVEVELVSALTPNLPDFLVATHVVEPARVIEKATEICFGTHPHCLPQSGPERNRP